MIRRSILLCTPPFVQSNTPYPATMYVTGLLRKNGYTAHQCDLSIKTFRAVFSALFLERAFSEAAPHIAGTFFARHRRRYCDTVEDVIRFLRGKDPALAYRIVSRNFLPEGKRFTGIEKPKSPFDTADYAKYLATLYIEDLYDFFRIYIDANFGLTRYAEKISASVKRFSVLDDHLKQKPSLIEQVTLDILDSLLEERPADALGVTIPFPGNLIPALRMCAHIRKKYPHMTTIAGGGYVSTELRQIESTDFFSLANYLVLDGGSNALMRILDGDVTPGEPVAGTIYCHDGRLVRGEEEPFVPDRRTSLFPDYDGIDPDEYVSLTDTVNPMMRLWNDGFWNKLTAAYGCYWSRCAFCDTSLDYIRTFAPLDTDALLERIRSVRKQTKQSGFHFTDEAAPPSALKKLALRLIRDGENISYWTNIRLEPAYSVGLCRLLAFSGCIAVSGGIEVASDRVLARMDKGVSVDDIIKCAFRFSQAGVMVHAYLMYAFPTETAAETVTALEIIRQLFAAGCIDSAYWHRFSLT
ncbi:MAG: B12-binding domain-containing radical SAM protein, partial [Spirochaetota bacterium]